jgi:hypothetical protein
MPSQRNGRVRPGFALTKRDLDILNSVASHGFLTRRQVQQLFFRTSDGTRSQQVVCRRLKRLAEWGYLCRQRAPVTSGSGPYIYALGPEIASVLCPPRNATSRRIPRGHSMKLTAQLPHSLGIIDFYVAFRTHLADLGGEIMVWLGEREARYALPNRGRQAPFTPDAYCLWSLSGFDSAFFLEWDQGTESMMRIGEKLERYDSYYLQRAYLDHLGDSGVRPRILFVACTERGRDSLCEWIGRQLSRGRFGSLPTVLVACSSDALVRPLEHVWCPPRGGGPERLAD